MHPSVANDLATHNNATFAKFKTCLLIQITDDSVKKINCDYRKLHCCLGLTALKSTNRSQSSNIFMYIII